MTEVPPADDGQRPGAELGWTRVHWATPYVRSWSTIVVGGFVVAQNVGQDAVSRLFGGGDGPDDLSGASDAVDGLGSRVVTFALLAVAVVLLAGVGLAVLSWRATRYRITAEALELHQGLLFRNQKAARLDRIQAVDVVRPFLGRLLGLAQVTVEVAGGGNSKFVLRYLREPVAAQLRNRVLAGAAGLTVGDDQPAPEADERPVVEVGAGRLLASLALTGTVVVIGGVVAACVVTSVLLRSAAPLAFVAPAALGGFGTTWNRFAREFGFRVGVAADGLRLRHGLLELKSQTVPPGRVQAVRMAQPLLWRGRDWWRLEVNVAGYGPARSEGDRETVLLPVGTRADVLALVEMLVADLGEPPGARTALLDAALSGLGPQEGFVTAPPRARLLDPFGYRRTGVRATPTALVLRGGRLRRHVDVVPHERTQSLGVWQGPWQRRRGLASVQLHSTPGPVSARAEHLDVADAAVLLEQQAARARAARAGAGPERWRERHPDDVGPDDVGPDAVTSAPPPAPAS